MAQPAEIQAELDQVLLENEAKNDQNGNAGEITANDFAEEGKQEEDTCNNINISIHESLRQLRATAADAWQRNKLMPMFTKPTQRQRWEDTQIAPHKEWGDIFYDLFYVATAYNLGTVLRLDPSVRGLFYFFACFFPIQQLWQYKMYYDSRFYTGNDIWHSIYDIAMLVTLGAAVLYIRPVAVLSRPQLSSDLFGFCSAIFFATILSMGRLVEILFTVDGDVSAARRSAVREISLMSVPAMFYLAGAIGAGVQYYGNQGGDNQYASYADGDNYVNDTSHKYDAGDHRFLAGSDSSAYGGAGDRALSDFSMWMLYLGFISNHVLWFASMSLCLPADPKQAMVPMNIEMAIHRYGEWTMLMIGEGVLSLLIVGVDANGAYYQTFYCGVISMTLLVFLHFRSQPHDPEHHASRRKKERGYGFVLLIQVYSAALIILGASYKMLLLSFYESDDGSHRMLFSSSPLQRLLAGGGGGGLQLDSADREQRIAHFFCGSMAAVWLCLDLLILIHGGLKENMKKCQGHAMIRAFGLVLILSRIGLIAWMATLSQYVTEKSLLSSLGLVGIAAQLILRVVGTLLTGDEDEEEEELLEDMRSGFMTMNLSGRNNNAD